MNRKCFLSSLITAGSAIPEMGARADNRDFRDGAPLPLRLPAYLLPGDTIGITCPAGSITLKEIQPAMQLIESWGFKLRIGETVGKKDFTFGGSDAERAADLQQMLDDPSLKAILCARGGDGGRPIIHRLDFKRDVPPPQMNPRIWRHHR